MDEQEKSFLGVGWAFPPTFNKSRADVEMVTESQDIKESLEIYFATRFGERVMRGRQLLLLLCCGVETGSHQET